LKYSGDGDQVWLARHEGAARALAVDGSGNVYVAGQSGDQYATIRYDSDGNEVWIAGCHGRACGKGEAAAISLDEAGNVYVTGSVFGGPGARYGYVTVKYGSDGLQRWVIRYDAPGGGEIEAADIEVDGAGNVFVTGSVVNVDWDFLTVAYDGGGNLLWVGSYDGPSGRRDKAAAVAVDPSGNVYVTGRSDGGATCSDYALVKYLPGD
jgi:hypothetical protein